MNDDNGDDVAEETAARRSVIPLPSFDPPSASYSSLSSVSSTSSKDLERVSGRNDGGAANHHPRFVTTFFLILYTSLTPRIQTLTTKSSTHHQYHLGAVLVTLALASIILQAAAAALILQQSRFQLMANGTFSIREGIATPQRTHPSPSLIRRLSLMQQVHDLTRLHLWLIHRKPL